MLKQLSALFDTMEQKKKKYVNPITSHGNGNGGFEKRLDSQMGLVILFLISLSKYSTPYRVGPTFDWFLTWESVSSQVKTQLQTFETIFQARHKFDCKSTLR